MKTLVIIPSRLSATRLPGKPLLKINGISMISHVFRRAADSNIGDVLVATEDKEILEDVEKNGGQAILTKNKHKTGTDRIYEVLEKIDDSNIDLVMNIQGDEPLINIDDIKNLNNLMIKKKSDLGTLASEISNSKFYEDTNVVKVKTKEKLDKFNFPEAIDFKRKVAQEKKNIYHHVGIYCYKFETLKKFVSCKQSDNEISEKLEQLRALDNGIKINVALTESSSIGVDTEEDYVAIKKIMEYKS